MWPGFIMMAADAVDGSASTMARECGAFMVFSSPCCW